MASVGERRPDVWLADKVAGSTISFIVTLVLGAVLGVGATQITNNITHYGSGGDGTGVHSDDWEDHRSAWTLIIASARTQGEAEAAVEYARRIPNRGMTIGILDSNDYKLEPNYWVAFVGQFDTAQEADRVKRRYESRFNLPFARFIEEK